MAIDLARLVDEVLTMAKKRQEQNVINTENERWDKVTAFQRKRDAEAETAAKGHGYAMKQQRLKGDQEKDTWGVRIGGEERIQKLRNIGETDKQGLVNTGNLDVQRESNVGALTRQKIVSESNERVADTQLTGTKYTQDRMLESEKYKVDDPDKLIGEWVKSGLITDPSRILEMRRRLRDQNAANKPPGTDKDSFYGQDFSKSIFSSESPSMTRSPNRSSLVSSSTESRSTVIPEVKPIKRNWITEGIQGMGTSTRRRPELLPPIGSDKSELEQLFRNPWSR